GTLDGGRGAVKALSALGPLLLAVAALLLVFRLLVPGFLTPNNLLDLVQQISINAILAFGMTLVILIGGIDLSVGAVVALVGTTAVYLMTRQVPMPLAVLAAFAVAGTFGVLHGALATATPMPPFIITLATMLVA